MSMVNIVKGNLLNIHNSKSSYTYYERYCTNLSSLKIMRIIKLIIPNMYKETKVAIIRSYFANMNSTML